VAGSCEYGDEPSGSGATELVRTSKKTRPITITKIGLLMLLEVISADHSENCMKPINTLYE
jgi:hypothetical protein